MPPIEALKPPADIVADKPTQAPPKGDKPKDADLAPPPPPLQDVLPSPDQDLAPPTAAEFAKVEPAPPPPPRRPATDAARTPPPTATPPRPPQQKSICLTGCGPAGTDGSRFAGRASQAAHA